MNFVIRFLLSRGEMFSLRKIFEFQTIFEFGEFEVTCGFETIITCGFEVIFSAMSYYNLGTI